MDILCTAGVLYHAPCTSRCTAAGYTVPARYYIEQFCLLEQTIIPVYNSVYTQKVAVNN